MVIHQAVTIKLKGIPLFEFFDCFKIGGEIALFFKNTLAIVTSIDNVINQSF
jgi:hypothetical protein